MGYRKHDYKGKCIVQTVNRYRKKIPRAIRKWWKRRSAIEPVIGHMKNDNRMNCNKLKGKLGDKINAVLSACGFNFRKLLRAIVLFFVFVLKMAVFVFLTEKKLPKELSLLSLHEYNFGVAS